MSITGDNNLQTITHSHVLFKLLIKQSKTKPKTKTTCEQIKNNYYNDVSHIG